MAALLAGKCDSVLAAMKCFFNGRWLLTEDAQRDRQEEVNNNEKLNEFYGTLHHTCLTE